LSLGRQLGRPGDKVVAQEDSIAGGGATSVRTTNPVSICVDNQLRRRGEVNQTIVNRAMNVMKEVLLRNKMWLSEIMHMKTDLLNSIRQSGLVKVRYYKEHPYLQIASPNYQQEWSKACNLSS
jgi:hypothetical protein